MPEDMKELFRQRQRELAAERASQNGKARTAVCRRLIACRFRSSNPRSKPPWLNNSEIRAIAADPAPPDFENTIVALERAGSTLDRVGTLYGVWGSTMASPELPGGAARDGAASRRVQRSDHAERSALQTNRSRLQLAGESKAERRTATTDLALLHQLCSRRRSLNADAKKRLSQINQQLAGLYTKFSQNVLAEETDQFIVLKSEDELADCRSRCATLPRQPPRRRNNRARG
jgi:Zn-dependent oligopeptidase